MEQLVVLCEGHHAVAEGFSYCHNERKRYDYYIKKDIDAQYD